MVALAGPQGLEAASGGWMTFEGMCGVAQQTIPAYEAIRIGDPEILKD